MRQCMDEQRCPLLFVQSIQMNQCLETTLDGDPSIFVTSETAVGTLVIAVSRLT